MPASTSGDQAARSECQQAKSALHFTNERGCSRHLSCVGLSYGCLSCAIKKKERKKKRGKRTWVLTHKIPQPPRRGGGPGSPQTALSHCCQVSAERPRAYIIQGSDSPPRVPLSADPAPWDAWRGCQRRRGGSDGGGGSSPYPRVGSYWVTGAGGVFVTLTRAAPLRLPALPPISFGGFLGGGAP